MASAELIKEIEADINGTFQKDLEKKTVASINRLEQQDKVSKDEVTKLYRTDFKKLFSGKIDSTDILVAKVEQVNKLTNKLLAVRLNSNKEEPPYIIKRAIYGIMSIEADLKQNNVGQNLAKWVIDELLALPEMLLELVKHPIDFAKGLKTALIDNFAETMKIMMSMYTDAFQGIETPDKQYKTWRSLTLIIMTLIPWAASKGLTNLAKNVQKTGGKLLKWEFKAVGKDVLISSKNVLNNTKEAIVKKATNIVEPVTNRVLSKQLKYSLISTEKNIVKLTDDIAATEKLILKKKNSLKMKNITKEAEQTIQETIKKLEDNLQSLTKNRKEAISLRNKNVKELKQTNTKLWIDNNRVWVKKRLETNAKKIENDIAVKQGELLKQQNSLKIKNMKPQRIETTNKAITKLEKEIQDLTTKQKDLLTKAKNYDIRIQKPARIQVRKSLKEKFKSIKQESLDNLVKLPQRVPVLKDLLKLRKLNTSIKRLSQEVESINVKLSKLGKNGKPLIYNAKVRPNHPWAKKAIQLESKMHATTKAIDKMKAMKKASKENLTHTLIWLGVVVPGTLTANLISDELVHNLAEYLIEPNDEFINGNQDSLWLASWSTDVSFDAFDWLGLDGLTIEEQKTIEVNVVGKASKTWSESINQKLAEQRAKNAKTLLLEKYHSLNPDNIHTTTQLQSQDSTDDISLWQWVSIDTKIADKTYVGGLKG